MNPDTDNLRRAELSHLRGTIFMPICLGALSQFNNEGINYQVKNSLYKPEVIDMSEHPQEKINSSMKKLQIPLCGFLIFIFLFIIQLGNLETYSSEEKQLTMKNEKYLIPILVWGPNNMIQGLRESLFIADTLGRKVSCNMFQEFKLF